MKGIILKAVFLLSITGPLWAQQSEMAGIKLLAKAKRDTILLRWAPNNSSTWALANKYGYTVERFTITRGDQLLAPAEKSILTSQPLKPAALALWERDSLNDYSMIAAEAIFSSSFDLSLPSKGVYEVVAKTQENDQRYSFAMLAADHSFKTASLSGLAFTDTNVKKDEKYFYRVFVTSPDSKIKLDTGIFFIGLRDTLKMPPPANVQAEFRDRMVRLTWPKSFLEKGYSSFVVERTDEKTNTFQRLNQKSFINFENANEPDFQFLDSIPENGIKYSFRIRGITPFGELGPPSETVSGMGSKNLIASVSIDEAYEFNPGVVKISWHVTGDLSTVQQVSVQRSLRADGNYKTIERKNVQPEQASYIDRKPLSTAYYRIKIANAQDSIFSFPYLVQLLDSIPPGAPQNLKGIIDTTGIVQLAWLPNTEIDLLGYRVFRSNFRNSEFSQITSDPVLRNNFLDTLDVKTLTKDVFYKIVAVDQRYNPSAYSEILKIEKPDVVAPQPPVLQSVVQAADKIKIKWIASPSEDVIAYKLLKSSGSRNDWRLVKQIQKDSLYYTDDAPDGKETLHYGMQAIDKAGNTSRLTPHFTIVTLVENKKPVEKLSFVVNREEKNIQLKWKRPDGEVKKYLIYRSDETSGLSLYKTITGSIESWKDINLKMDTTYTYRIKTSFTDGSESSFSEEIVIRY